MIRIDGSIGEGGGQILRTSLSLAAITGQEVCFEKIRSNREKPGLMRQHLMCVKAVSEICGGETEGAELRSQALRLKPGKIRGGAYHFAIGSAGSTILLAQAILPVLLLADAPSEVVLEGGTYNTTACPSYDFLERVFLPCLRAMGAEVDARMEQIGFCPVGGGRVVLSVKPARVWSQFTLCERGELQKARVTALGSGLEPSILADELRLFQDGLGGQTVFEPEARMVKSEGSGNFLYSELEFEHITELFGICGSLGVSRKSVAQQVTKMTKRYLRGEHPVGPFLADQLLLPMALGAGGRFLTCRPFLHTRTNCIVIQKFLNVPIEIREQKPGCFEVEVIK